MSFDKIGPYDLDRGDLILAAVTISFIVGGLRTRIFGVLYVVVGLAVSVVGFVINQWTLIGFGIFIILTLFIIGPALRSRKRSRGIMLSFDDSGLIADTVSARTTYKWPSIENARMVGTRLYIMIGQNVAIPVPPRTTSPENMLACFETVKRLGGHPFA